MRICKLCKHPENEHEDDGDDFWDCMICGCTCSEEDFVDENEKNETTE